jgi:tRNA threonylcarbamoyladenosine biosynthesis protein TsaE
MKKNDFDGKAFITGSSGRTRKLGHDFAKTLNKGEIICLYGDLGSGKTTFVQGLAQGLGIKSRIISPTFVIIRSHRLKVGVFCHIDLYRTEVEKDIENLGLEEIMNDPQNIIAIEWAEKLKDYLPEKRIDIEFVSEKENIRKIMFRSSGQ